MLLVPGTPVGAGARDVVGRFVALSDGDWAEIERGQPAVKNLPAIDRKEVAVAVVLKTRGRAAVFRQWATSPDALRHDEVVGMGALSAPPDIRDLDGLELEAHSREKLLECKPGACGVKLSAAAMERIYRAAGDRDEADAAAATAGEFREIVLEIAGAYRSGGPDALPPYDDRKEPVRVAEQLPGILDRLPVLTAHLPALRARLERPPLPIDPPDRLYWSKEKYWRREVVLLTHVTVEEVPSDRMVVAASKMLYANHYFEGLVRLAALVEDGDHAYLVDLSRARSDHKRGGFSFIERALVQRLLKGRLERQAVAYRTRLEAVDAAHR